MQRPTGVTILAILALIGGILGLVGGLFLFGIASTFAVLGISGLATIVAIVLIVGGVLDLFLAYGAWNLRPWAWTLGIVAEIVAIVSQVLYIGNGLANSIIGIAIAVGIIYYLYQPRVRRAFGQTV
jgi:uncharacterized membrane protein (DUF2068 family)